MSENEAVKNESSKSETKLPCLYAFKVGMTQFVDDKGEMVPCTVLKYEPMKISQLKTDENDGYTAVQVACKMKKEVKLEIRNGSTANCFARHRSIVSWLHTYFPPRN